MADSTITYLTDSQGNPTAVVIPIDLWRKLLPQESGSIKDVAEHLEDYCLSKAMNEARATPLLRREEALKFLEEEDAD
ncbi:MAG: hypothetical protein ACFBSF_07430 [Leptolyngbyaceae cyanobacterium]